MSSPKKTTIMKLRQAAAYIHYFASLALLDAVNTFSLAVIHQNKTDNIYHGNHKRKLQQIYNMNILFYASTRYL
ncbi:hypothetical protein AB4K20DRAFT_1883018 [Rhizopus microsporus]